MYIIPSCVYVKNSDAYRTCRTHSLGNCMVYPTYERDYVSSDHCYSQIACRNRWIHTWKASHLKEYNVTQYYLNYAYRIQCLIVKDQRLYISIK